MHSVTVVRTSSARARSAAAFQACPEVLRLRPFHPRRYWTRVSAESPRSGPARAYRGVDFGTFDANQKAERVLVKYERTIRKPGTRSMDRKGSFRRAPDRPRY